jgi:hypothetical protein
MWADDLRLSVLLGLLKGLSLCRGMRWALTDNWKIEQGPIREWHSRMMGKGD